MEFTVHIIIKISSVYHEFMMHSKMRSFTMYLLTRHYFQHGIPH